MNRIVKSLLVYILYLILVIYMVYESVFIVKMGTYEQFLNGYLRTVQKHLFNTMIIISIYLIVIRVPYLKPEYRIRYKEDLFYIQIKKACIISFIWSIYIYLLYIIIPFLFGYDIFISHWLKDISRLFTYIFSLYILGNVFYIITGNGLIGVLLTSGLNILSLAAYLSISFYIVQGGIVEVLGLNYLLIISSVISLLSIGYLYYYFKFKDSLQ